MSAYLPVTLNLALWVGEDCVMEWPVVDEDTGLPLHMTGQDIELRLFSDIGGDELLLKDTTVGGITLGDSTPADGFDDDLVRVSFDHDDTDGPPELRGTFYYVLRQTTPGANHVLAHGPFTIR